MRPTASGKVLAILDAFDADHTALTLSQLARRCNLPLSTAHRLAAELTAWGGLERGPDQRFRIGLHLWEIASMAPRGLGLREAAMPYMSDLFEATHENVQLAVREGIEVVFVDRIAGRHAVPVLTRVGLRFPMSATGVGLVLLAYAPPEVQEQALSTPMERFTPKTVVDPVQLRRVLAEVRRTGLAVSDRQVTMDALSVAAPVIGPDGRVLAALSVVVQADRAQPTALAPAVRAAARGISRVLGAPLQPRTDPAG
ncbi:MAG TPA: IclR family transcriptional regulator [Kineosporiaceae bacterium]|nr:IclR family transcriptional regulator [Kineosporiaceae bacterium]